MRPNDADGNTMRAFLGPGSAMAGYTKGVAGEG
jgi:hypothetical protein